MNLVILSLFLTNVWIFFYKNILFYLRLKIPPPSIADFVVVWPLPEPSEIPLYLTLITLFTLLIFFLYKYILIKVKKNITGWPKYILLLLLIFVFLNNIGQYPLKGDFFPYKNPEPASINLLFFLSYIGIILMIFFFSHLFTFRLKSKTLSWRIFAFLILVVIAFFTFEAKFPISPHDYSFFIGPIYEVAQGKTIFTQATSQYGFLSVLFLAMLYKLKILGLAYLPAFIWLLYIFQYFLCFFLIYKISGSKILALISIFSVLTLNYFSLYHLPIALPQVGAMRWFPLILSVWLFYRLKGFQSKKFIFAVSLLGFWVVDSGLALYLACGLTIFYLWLGKQISLTRAIKYGIELLLGIIVIFLTINSIGLISGYASIDFLQIFLRIRQYSQAGFGMLPMESYTYFWIVIFIYFLSLVYFFSREKPDFGDQVLLFCSNLSITASIYFVGRSHSHNLFNIAVFPLLNLFIFLGLIYRNKSANFKLLTSILLFFLLIVIPAYNRKETITKLIKQKLKQANAGKVFASDFDNLLRNRFSEEIILINENLPAQEVALLSIDDTFLLYLTGKKDLLYNNPQIAATSYEDIKFTLQKAVKVCPEKIAIDCRVLKMCPEFSPLNESSVFIPPLLLDELQNQCQVKYSPVKCSQQLCIAVSQKKP